MGVNIRAYNSPRDFYKNGVSFMESSLRCYGKEENGEYKIIDKGKVCQLTAPVVVNAAFACEMFLKALLMNAGILYNKKHNLVKLFDLLPEDIRREISRFCGNSEDETVFRMTLSKHANDFVDIRYFVENNDWGHMSPTYMVALAHNMSLITRCLLFDSSNPNSSIESRAEE